MTGGNRVFLKDGLSVLLSLLLGVFFLSGFAAQVGVVWADSPVTWGDMARLEESAGNATSGAKYISGGGNWDPWNWARTDIGPDCSGFVGKVWQYYVGEVIFWNHDMNTADLAPNCQGNPRSWYQYITRDQLQVHDALVIDADCWNSSDGHVRLYEGGDPYGQFWIYEATDLAPYHRVVLRPIYWQDGYQPVRRNHIAEPGVVGREDNNTENGALHQPIVDAYNRVGGADSVGNIRYNGGGFLVHRWGSGYVQDFDGGSGGTGALMQADSNSSMSYWIHGSIWDWYVKERGAVGWLGYPTNDEEPQTNFCGNSRPRSNLQGGYITYDDCQKFRYRSFTNNGRVPLHRYYIPATGKHFYADNYYEGDIQNGNQEGIMGYMRPNLVAGTKALYRWFAPSNNDHLYTDNPYEQPGGYNYEGIEGYVYQNGGGGFYPIHRLYNPSSGEHFYTNSDGEKNYLVSIGWSYEGVMGYLSSAP